MQGNSCQQGEYVIRTGSSEEQSPEEGSGWGLSTETGLAWCTGGSWGVSSPYEGAEPRQEGGVPGGVSERRGGGPAGTLS